MPSEETTRSALDPTRALQLILTRERLFAAAGTLAVVGVAWAYLLRISGGVGGDGMAMTDAMAIPQARGANFGDFGLTFAMWGAMMVAMMVPSAAPMILLYASAGKNQGTSRYLAIVVFIGAYLLVWGGFAATAAAAHIGFQSASLLSDELKFASAIVGAVILIGAGAYQWTNLKAVCVTTCRSPLSFLMTEWRSGTFGGLRMGVRHGIYCLGCCWVLMVLLFVGGVMNLVWIGGIAAFVLVEKLVPSGVGMWFSRASGVLLAAWGGVTLIRAIMA